MPSGPSTPECALARRHLLSTLGTAAAAGLTGCAGRLPGTGPVRLDAERTVERDRIRWAFPPREGDAEGVGYAAVSVDRRPGRGDALDLQCNATVGGIASSDPSRGYETDRFRFRVAPPPSYAATFEVRVQPPGQWEGFSAYYDHSGARRWAVVELRDVDTAGTVVVPAVFDPAGSDVPESLDCAFAVQASRPGPFGKTVRATGSGTLDLDGE